MALVSVRESVLCVRPFSRSSEEARTVTPEERAHVDTLEKALSWHHRYLRDGEKCSTCGEVKGP